MGLCLSVKLVPSSAHICSPPPLLWHIHASPKRLIGPFSGQSWTHFARVGDRHAADFLTERPFSALCLKPFPKMTFYMHTAPSIMLQVIQSCKRLLLIPWLCNISFFFREPLRDIFTATSGVCTLCKESLNTFWSQSSFQDLISPQRQLIYTL